MVHYVLGKSLLVTDNILNRDLKITVVDKVVVKLESILYDVTIMFSPSL